MARENIKMKDKELVKELVKKGLILIISLMKF